MTNSLVHIVFIITTILLQNSSVNAQNSVSIVTNSIQQTHQIEKNRGLSITPTIGIDYGLMWGCFTTDLNPELRKYSPISNLSMKVGALINDVFGVSLSLSKCNGEVLYDFSNSTPFITTYYEDRIDMSILSKSIIAEVFPFKFGPFSTSLALGCNWNKYKSFKRTVFTEEYYENINIVLTSYDTVFPQPPNFLSGSIDCRLICLLGDHHRISLGFLYSNIFEKDREIKYMTGCYIGYAIQLSNNQ